MKSAVYASQADFYNGNARDMIHMLLHTAHEHWQCGKHYYQLTMQVLFKPGPEVVFFSNSERPGTHFERCGIDAHLEREDGLSCILRVCTCIYCYYMMQFTVIILIRVPLTLLLSACLLATCCSILLR